VRLQRMQELIRPVIACTAHGGKLSLLLTPPAFARLSSAWPVADGAFIEHARVHENLYGTSVAAVRAVTDAGKTCLLDIDTQGAEAVKKTDLHARFLFIAPPSMGALEQRLRGRATENEEKIQLRMGNAHGEMAYTKKEGFFDAVIVNDDFERAYAEFKQALQLS
jgi:guanylate kinase